MKNFKSAALALGLMISGNALTCSIDGKGGFLPDNDLYIPTGAKSFSNTMTQAQFNQAIDKVESIYAPIIANKGAKLIIQRNWGDGTVNAYAQQQSLAWNVAMFGGLARHPAITPDGMSLVVCHEIGHHIGGAPKKISEGDRSWATNEGQADYFSSLKCLRKAFLNDNNIKIVASMNVPKFVKDACQQASKNNKEDAALCIRISMAGKSVSNLFSELNKLPETKFETPDQRVVKVTNDSHPMAQCRLDTYFQGALCDVSFNEDVSQISEVKGTCHNTLGHKVGTRPLCWHKPKSL